MQNEEVAHICADCMKDIGGSPPFATWFKGNEKQPAMRFICADCMWFICADCMRAEMAKRELSKIK